MLRLDGSTANPAVVESITRAMSFRGGDGWRSQASGAFIAGVTLSSQLGGAELASAEGIIVLSYSRIDARTELITALRAHGRRVDSGATDAELFLHGYRLWNGSFLDRVLGDFALILWDQERRTLFAAVDHFGVRPLYYVIADGALIITNTPTAILDTGVVSRDIDEVALGDFLCFGFPLDSAATLHRAVRRLPPAHQLHVNETTLSLEPYWTVPHPTEYHPYGSHADYAEQFRELFCRVVADRLPPSGPINIMMSGGMDSTSIAAAAREVIGPEQASERIVAHTQVYRDLIRDEEGKFASIASEWLGVRTRVVVTEEFRFQDTAPSVWCSPEPTYLGGRNPEHDMGAAVEAAGGVLLTGLGGDPLFASRTASFWDLVGSRGLRGLRDAARCVSLFGQLPSLEVRRQLRLHLLGTAPSLVPIWINRAYAQRTGLHDRAARYAQDLHKARPQQTLTGTDWSYRLASADAGRSGMPIEFRHPFLDVRLLEWMLKVPQAMLIRKQVLRAAMAGLLPPSILARPKTLLGNAAAVAERRHPAVVRRHNDLLQRVPRIAEYVDLPILKRCLNDPNEQLALGLNRFEMVALWLASRH